MDENTWRLAQVAMWLVGLQTSIIIAVVGAFWASMNKKMERIEGRVNVIEHDMTEVKTILRMKECCMIQEPSQIKKAE